MEIDDHILKLAAKKMAKEATTNELHELNDLLNKNPLAKTIINTILASYVDDKYLTEDDGIKLFAKIEARIKCAKPNLKTRTIFLN